MLGDNFVGMIYRILYKDANETSDKNQSSLILKIAPTDEFRREKQKLRELFLREISIYDEVKQNFDEINFITRLNHKITLPLGVIVLLQFPTVKRSDSG